MDEHTERLYQAFMAKPSDANAFKALSEQLFFRGEWLLLIEVYEKRANSCHDETEAAKLFHQAGGVSETKLNHAKKAIYFYRKAVAADHNLHQAVADLRRKYSETGDHEGAVRLMEEELRSIPEPGARAAKLLEIADVYETKIGLIPKALEKYEQVLDIDPSNRQALLNLEKGFRSLSNWEALRELFDGIIPDISDESHKAQVLFKLGKLYQNQLSDPIRAARCFEEVKEINRSAQSIYKDLETLYEMTENRESLARILREEAGLHIPEKEKSALLRRASDVLAGRPLRPEEPRSAQAGAAAQAGGPNQAKAMEDRIASAASPGEKAQAFVELGEAHLAAGDPRKAEECAVRAADIAPPGHGSERRALSLLFSSAGEGRFEPVLAARLESAAGNQAKAELHIVHGDLLKAIPARRKDAVRIYQLALKLDPANPEAQKSLEQLWSETGHREGLTSLYRWQMSKGPETSGRRGAALKLAQLYAADPARAAEAERIFQSVLGEDPSDQAALRGLEVLYKSGKDHEALAGIYIRMAGTSPDPAQAANALFNAARLYRDMIGNPGKAADIYRRILASNPGDLQAAASLEQTLDDAGDVQGLAAFLRERADAAGPPLRLELFFRLGTLLKDRIGDHEAAAEAFEDIAQEEPDNLEVLCELEQIYEGLGKWEDLAAIINRRLSSSPDSREAHRLHMKMGGIWEKRLNDAETASIAFEKAASLLPSDPEPLARLLDIYRRLGKWEDFLRISLRYRSVSAPAGHPELLVETADVCRTRLGDPQRALEIYEQALILSPGFLPAVRGQKQTYLERGDYAAYANRTILESAYVTDAPRKASILREAGRILIDAAPLEPNTLDVWEELGAAAGLDTEVLAALSAIHRGLENWEKFVEYTMLLASREPENDKSAQLMLDAASVLENQMQKPAGALEVLRRILERSPDDPAAVAGLARLSEEAGDFEAAKSSLENALRKDLPADERAKILEKLAGILENNVMDLDGAVRAYEEMSSLDPSNPKPIAHLERVLLKAGRDGKLLEILESADPITEAGLNMRLRAADIRMRRTFDPAGAAEDLRAVLRADPRNPAAVKGLMEILPRIGAWIELADLLEAGIAAAESPAASDLVEAGLVMERRAGRLERAQELYAAAAAADPRNLVALRCLARARRRLGMWDGVAAALEMEAAALQGPAGAGAALEIARICEEKIGDLARAQAWYEEALSRRKGDAEAQAALEIMYERTARTDRLEDLLKQRLRSGADDRQKSAACSRLGRMCMDRGDFKAALESFRAAADFVPYSLEALRGIQNAAKKLGDWDACIDSLKKEIALHGDVGPRVTAHRGLSILYQEKGEPGPAIEQLKLAFEADARSPEVALGLAGLLRSESRWKELFEVLVRSAEFLPSVRARAAALAEAGQIAQEKLSDPQRARGLLERAVLVDPRSEEAIKLLGNLLFAEGDHAALLKLLEREIDLRPDGPGKSTLMTRAADLCMEHFQDSLRAGRLLVSALQMDPDNMRAIRLLSRLKDDLHKEIPKSARARLGMEVSPEERLKALVKAAKAASGDKAIALWKAVADENPTDGEVMMEIARLCEATNRHMEAAVWIGMAAASTGDPFRAYNLQMRAGDLLAKKLGKAEAAFDAYYEAWKANPDAEGLASEIASSAAQLGRWEQHVEARKALCEKLPSAEKAKALAEIGAIVAGKLGSPEKAGELLLAAHEIAPDDPVYRKAALEHLRSSGDWENLCRVLSSEHESFVSRGVSAFETAAEIGEIYASRLGNLNLAVEWYYKAVKENPSATEVLRRMQDVLRRAGKYRDLEEILDLEISLESTDEARQMELLEMKARLYEDNLADEAMAIDALEGLYGRKPGDVEILRRLERVCRRGGYWIRLAGVFSRLAESAAENAEKAEYHVRIAEVFTAKMSDPARAREALLRAVSLDPDGDKARKMLEDLKSD